MGTVATEVIIILLLIAINGGLAMTEMAVVSARRAGLRQRAETGDRGAEAALALAEEPGRFLSTVQIGITLVGILAGAFGGATIARTLAATLDQIPFLARYSQSVSVVLVVVVISYLTLVLGELAPKQVGLKRAEEIAARTARPMTGLARLTWPLVRVLNLSSNGVLRLLGLGNLTPENVTEDEIRLLVRQGTTAGVLEPIEEEIVTQLFRLSDRTVAALVTPRPDIVWIDRNDDLERRWPQLLNSEHSRFPVVDGDLDNVVGVLRLKEYLRRRHQEEGVTLDAVLQPALFVPETMPALALLERFRATASKMALVIDEFGGLVGLVTINDVVEAIVGDLPDSAGDNEAVARADGSWLVDGSFPLDEFQEMFNLRELPEDVAESFQTVGGLIMGGLGRLPATGDLLEWRHLQMEVVDMDGRRVDKVLVTPRPLHEE